VSAVITAVLMPDFKNALFNISACSLLTAKQRNFRLSPNLKYQISKFKDGVYIQMNYEANGETVGLVEKSMKLNESILRYLTTKN
jgi:hypothetical protein